MITFLAIQTATPPERLVGAASGVDDAALFRVLAGEGGVLGGVRRWLRGRDRFWRGQHLRGGGLFGMKGGEHVFDLLGLEVGHVQQAEGDFALGAAEGEGDAVSLGFDLVGEVGRQMVAVSDQQGVRLAEAAHARPGRLDIGGASGGLAVGRARRDFGRGGDQGGQVAAQDFGQNVIQIAKIAPDGARGHGEGQGQIGQRDGRPSMQRHQPRCRGKDAILPVQILAGPLTRAFEIFGLRAEDACWCRHAAERNRNGLAWQGKMTEPGVPRALANIAGTRDRPKRLRHRARVAVLRRVFEVSGNLVVGFEVIGRVEAGQWLCYVPSRTWPPRSVAL